MSSDRYSTSEIDEFSLADTRAALLVIDMQRGFIEEGSAYEAPAIRDRLGNVERLLAFARERGLPIVWTRSDHKPPYGGALYRKLPAVRTQRICWRGEESWEYYGGMSQPLPNEHEVVKHKFDAFFETDLDSILRNTGVETVIIMGVTTSVCCESTARSAFFRDYNVVFVGDATAEFDPQLHDATLRIIDTVFGRVVTTDELLTEMRAEGRQSPERVG